MPNRFMLETFAKLEPTLVQSLYKECTPKILVVTDGLSFNAASGFGLTQFVTTLATSTIHGMTPQVVTKVRSAGGFRFDDAAEGILKSRYDVVFILGIYGAGTDPLSAAEKDAIATFMQAGGGVFATGDHQDLGASMSMDIPRVRSMRLWTAGTPHVSNQTRISTNVAGSNELEDFSDQSDQLPQNLFPNFRTDAGNPGGLGRPGRAHPLLQLTATPSVANPVIEVFPDHPHEGECVVPSNLATTFALAGSNVEEWPTAPGGARVAPEAVAYSMSHGSGFTSGSKDALTPRAFIAICAYDGQRANVGRVATDATWHHFVNINLDGTGSGLLGLQSAPGVDGPALARVRQYYRNLATWLMPKNTRRCLRFPHFLLEAVRYPLFEELVVPRLPPGPDPDPLPLVQLGKAVVESLLLHEPPFVAETMLDDALQEAIGQRAAEQLAVKPARLGNLTPRELAFGAVGAMASSVLDTLDDLKDVKDIQPHKTFDKPATALVRKSARRLIDWQREELRTLDKFLEGLPQD
jgi:hypothetical protein